MANHFWLRPADSLKRALFLITRALNGSAAPYMLKLWHAKAMDALGWYA